MPLDADTLIERQRLRRRLTLWRILFVVAVAAAILAAVARIGGSDSPGDHVALLDVSGIIETDREREAVLDELADDDSVKALILRIDSPGGTFVGGESLAIALQRVAQKKPVVTIMDDVAASAGYMIATATDHIIARRGTITGSIGVIFPTTSVVDFFEKLGVTFDAIKSDPLKANPSPFEETLPAARAWTQTVVDQMKGVFVEMVAAGRPNLTPAEVARLADGRIYTGDQALANGLIDEIGGEREARAWLAANRDVPADLAVVEVTIDEEEWWLAALLGSGGKSLLPEALTLDGLLALWQPDGS
jgi:protease IV